MHRLAKQLRLQLNNIPRLQGSVLLFEYLKALDVYGDFSCGRVMWTHARVKRPEECSEVLDREWVVQRDGKLWCVYAPALPAIALVALGEEKHLRLFSDSLFAEALVDFEQKCGGGGEHTTRICTWYGAFWSWDAFPLVRKLPLGRPGWFLIETQLRVVLTDRNVPLACLPDIFPGVGDSFMLRQLEKRVRRDSLSIGVPLLSYLEIPGDTGKLPTGNFVVLLHLLDMYQDCEEACDKVRAWTKCGHWVRVRLPNEASKADEWEAASTVGDDRESRNLDRQCVRSGEALPVVSDKDLPFFRTQSSGSISSA